MATATGDNSKIMLRMSDLTSEPKRMLPPIKGYEKEPLVSIDQAIQPIISIVPDIEEMVWTVKQNCQQPRDKLSTDELASIMLYTLEWSPTESSFYFILNRTLRSQNRNELLPWFQYLRLFMVALSKLPTTSHRLVYRGIKMDISGEFPDGKTFIWWAFSSASSSVKVLEQFLGTTGHRTIFNIECDSAKDISKYSFYESENEILMFPARQFQVISTFNSGNQLKIVHLKEIQPPFPLIHIPPSLSTATDEKIKDAGAHASSAHSSSKYSDSSPFSHSSANTAASASKHKVVPPQPEIQEFAEPGTCEKLFCKGRPCAKCYKCRDWHFSGDQKIWNWVCNYKKWGDADRKLWCDSRYELFTKRDGATCFLYFLDFLLDRFRLRVDRLDHLCLCEMH